MSEHKHEGSRKAYIIGFSYSIILTVIPLFLVFTGLFSKTVTVVAILIAACLQFAVQLFYFMHIRESEKPGYNIMALFFGIIIVVTVIGGSAWVLAL